jgi:hypothetical protein
MTAKEWIAAYADLLGVEPASAEEFTAILELAAEAAHASERVAAPVACWIAAGSESTLEESLALARKVAPGGAGAE